MVSVSTAAPMILEDRSGRTERRKPIVSALMIHTSRKVAVIQMISYLSRDSRIKATIVTSDSAAATAGRRSSASQKKLTSPQVSRKTQLAITPPSLHTMSASAHRCKAATGPIRARTRPQPANVAAERLDRDASEGDMARRPCPAMKTPLSGARNPVIEVY